MMPKENGNTSLWIQAEQRDKWGHLSKRGTMRSWNRKLRVAIAENGILLNKRIKVKPKDALALLKLRPESKRCRQFKAWCIKKLSVRLRAKTPIHMTIKLYRAFAAACRDDVKLLDQLYPPQKSKYTRYINKSEYAVRLNYKRHARIGVFHKQREDRVRRVEREKKEANQERKS